MGFLLFFVGIALGISFLCSLLEASLLSSRTATLINQKKAGSVGAGLLLEIKLERVGDAITSILVFNTVANTLGATMAGAQAARVFGRTWVGLFSGILTFLILVFSEIIPKTLGAVYAKRLSPFVGRTLTVMNKITAPALVFTRALTRLITRDRVTAMSRDELAAAIALASREGAISGQESHILANLLRFNAIRVEDVMTPRTVAFMMPTDATVADLLADPDADPHSRIPLYKGDRDNVEGYVLQREVLRAAARGTDRTQRLERFMRKIQFIPENVSVGASLRQFFDRRESIAMVVNEHGGVDGLVTREDITETILGLEIVDESDRIVDLRVTAAQLRDRRIERSLAQARASSDEQALEPTTSVSDEPSAGG